MKKKILYRQTDTLSEYRNRAIVIKVGFGIFILIVVLRLFYIQVIKWKYYENIANEIYAHKVIIYARRGCIKDRNGKIIVTSRKTKSLGVEPILVKDVRSLLFYMKKWHADMEKVKRALNTKRFEWVLDDVSPALSAEIYRVDLPGTYLKTRYKRIYPSDNIGMNFIGLSKNGIGQSGIEYMFDDILRGENGWEEKHKRPWGSTVEYPGFKKKEPKDGKDITLTIDWDIQTISERLLREYVHKTHAKMGMVLIVNPKTGEILAMANYPEKDSVTGFYKNNYILEYAYEPGSVIKPLLLSYMFDDPNFQLRESDTVADTTGKMLLDGKEITDHDEHGYLNVRDAVVHSSNVAFARLALQYGPNKVYEALKEFGFGMKTFVNYKGESPGIVRRFDRWRQLDLATIGYGYGFMATLMQLVMAYSSLANDGKLLEPVIMKENASNPRLIRHVISPVTARHVRDIMVDVVERGTGTKAKVSGLKIAGKTGTAHKLNKKTKRYSNKYIASFIGMFPADDPEFVIGVVLDEPSYAYRFGGTSSAPLFKDIVERICLLPKYRYIMEDSNEKSSMSN